MNRHEFSARGNFEPINNGFATNSAAARLYLAVCIFTPNIYSSSVDGLYFLHIFPPTFTYPLVFHERVLLSHNSARAVAFWANAHAIFYRVQKAETMRVQQHYEFVVNIK